MFLECARACYTEMRALARLRALAQPSSQQIAGLPSTNYSLDLPFFPCEKIYSFVQILTLAFPSFSGVPPPRRRRLGCSIRFAKWRRHASVVRNQQSATCNGVGALNAKSIGWLPTKAHFADVKEAAKNNWHEGMLIVEECGCPSNTLSARLAVCRAVARLQTPVQSSLAIVDRVPSGTISPGFQTPALAHGADFVLELAGVTRMDESIG